MNEEVTWTLSTLIRVSLVTRKQRRRRDAKGPQKDLTIQPMTIPLLPLCQGCDGASSTHEARQLTDEQGLPTFQDSHLRSIST